MKKTLIIKLGALGDVVRTTVLLSELDGEIHWLSQRNAADLLGSGKIVRKFFIEDKADVVSLGKMQFDLVINLDEDDVALNILGAVKTDKLIGVFRNEDGAIDYTEESGYWYDMSLVSKLGKERADELKMRNRLTVPEILIGMVGKRFTGQEYDIGVEPAKVRGVIGLVNVSSGLWPNKDWHGYSKLARLLEGVGYEVRFLEMRPTLRDHIEDINACEAIVCGDTLGMHIALALRKNVTALFNCTSPYEIHAYGRMRKIVSPLYEEVFYKKERTQAVIESIPVEVVFASVMNELRGASPDAESGTTG